MRALDHLTGHGAQARIAEAFAKRAVGSITSTVNGAAFKRVELLESTQPEASRVALLESPDFPAAPKMMARVTSGASGSGAAITRFR